jgi:hypothetical protein
LISWRRWLERFLGPAGDREGHFIQQPGSLKIPMFKLDPDRNSVIYLFIAAVAFMALYVPGSYILGIIVLYAIIKEFLSQHHDIRTALC